MGGIHQLPEHLIHRVLSLFEVKEAARIGLVCKAWYEAWLTCPSLDFGTNVSASEQFIKFVDKTLGRYEEGHLRIDKLFLRLSGYDTKSFQQIDKWVDVAVKHGVESLRIAVLVDGRERYALPPVIIEAAKSLRELFVCQVNVEVVKTIPDKVMFSRLQRLDIWSVNIEDDTFERIIERCPLVDDLRVAHCKGLRRIKVTNLLNLKKLEVRVISFRCDSEAQLVEIYAPNLEHFTCEYCSFHLYAARNLKHLMLLEAPLPSATFLDDLMLNIPRLEFLSLFRYSYLERINISSHSLKTLELASLRNLRVVNIDAPNMDKFIFDPPFMFRNSGTVFPDISFVSAPSSSKWIMSQIDVSHPCLDTRLISEAHPCLDTRLISEVKGFLAKLNRTRISLLWFSFTGKQKPINLNDDDGEEESRKPVILPLVEVEKMWLQFYEPLTDAINFFDGLFRICRPKVVLMKWRGRATRLVYESLTGTTDKELMYDHPQLREVRFGIYNETNRRWMPSSWEEVPHACNKVGFKLQWEQTVEAEQPKSKKMKK